LDFCRETWGHVHDDYILHAPEKYGEWREHIFDNYRDAESGIGLPPGIVPSVTYWLTAGDRCIGAANIRKRLNETLRVYGGHIGLCLRPSERGKGYASGIMEKLTDAAKKLGIRELLITCFADNTPSRRINESLPGCRFEQEEIVYRGRPREICRYWRTLE